MNSQRAGCRSAGSWHSTTATWNWRGRHTIAVNASRVWARKPDGRVALANAPAPAATRVPMPPPPGRCRIASAPIATNASSLTSDSSAIASTIPRWCSVASIRRVPNRIAKAASSSATYRAGSAYHCAASGCPLSTPTLIPTALNCSAK